MLETRLGRDAGLGQRVVGEISQGKLIKLNGDLAQG
ncbi:hypothetical protein ID866_5989 [Astraeus odoratus]|nr:hypothetical protein ID866_5989 [Astraeus odoratus]